MLTIQHCIGQIKYGSVQYGKLTYKEFSKDTDKEMADWIAKSRNEADKIEYTLNFNTSEAYFFANSSLTENAGGFSLSAILGGGMLKYYQNNTSKEYREYRDSKRTGKVIVNLEQKVDWTLINETKTIDGKLCYKATSPYYQDGNKRESVTITAWYTPEIPISFGPAGFGGLPGLILELQGHKGTLYVKKINLILDKAPEIDKLVSQKAVTQEIYLQMLMGTFSQEQLDGIKEVDDKQKK